MLISKYACLTELFLCLTRLWATYYDYEAWQSRGENGRASNSATDMLFCSRKDDGDDGQSDDDIEVVIEDMVIKRQLKRHPSGQDGCLLILHLQYTALFFLSFCLDDVCVPVARHRNALREQSYSVNEVSKRDEARNA